MRVLRRRPVLRWLATVAVLPAIAAWGASKLCTVKWWPADRLELGIGTQGVWVRIDPVGKTTQIRDLEVAIGQIEQELSDLEGMAHSQTAPIEDTEIESILASQVGDDAAMDFLRLRSRLRIHRHALQQLREPLRIERLYGSATSGWLPGLQTNRTGMELRCPIYLILWGLAIAALFLWWLERHFLSPRTRRRFVRALWGMGATTAAVVLVVWGTNLRWNYMATAYGGVVNLIDGTLTVLWADRSTEPRIVVDRQPWATFIGAPTTQLLEAPVWAALVVIGAVVAIGSMWNRLIVSYIPCRKCGYNLTGNVSGRCPECGTRLKATLRSAIVK